MHRPDPLIGFLLKNCLLGIAVGWGILGGAVWLNVARLGDLLATADDVWIPLALGGMGFAVTFGSVAMGTAVFLLPKDGSDGH